MKKNVFQLAEGDAEDLRCEIEAQLKRLLRSRGIERGKNPFAQLLQRDSAFRGWWEDGDSLPAKTYCLGEYDVVVRGRPLGKVELILEQGRQNRLLVASDDSIDLEKRFSEPFCESYWVRCATPAVDDWFVGASASALQRRQGMLDVACVPEEELFVSNGEKFLRVCPLKPLRETATKTALCFLIHRWTWKHEVLASAQSVVDAYGKWLVRRDDSKLRSATKKHLALMSKTPAIRGKVNKLYAGVFQIVAEDLQMCQSLSYLTFMVVRDLDYTLSGKSFGSGPWYRKLSDLDMALMEAAHAALLEQVPTGKKNAEISKLVASKIEGEAALVAKR
jgi:hypothetical protein